MKNFEEINSQQRTVQHSKLKEKQQFVICCKRNDFESI